MTWTAMVILYKTNRGRIISWEVWKFTSTNFLPSSLKADIQWEFMLTQYIPAKKFRAMVIRSKSRKMMYGDPLHTCKEVSANGYRIEVEGHHVCLRIMVSQSRKTR